MFFILHCQDMLFFNFYFDQSYTPSLNIPPFTSLTILLRSYDLTIYEQSGFIAKKLTVDRTKRGSIK